MYEELISAAKALDERATPGPWMWDLRTGCRICQLVTNHSGQYYVMKFSRWGLQDACPEFQRFERYSGPVNERGGRGMVRADKMAKSYPGKEHHEGFDDYIDHPDAEYIAKSRAMFTELIAAIESLTAKNAALKADLARVTAERDAMEADLYSLNSCPTCKNSEIAFGKDFCPKFKAAKNPSCCDNYEWRGQKESD